MSFLKNILPVFLLFATATIAAQSPNSISGSYKLSDNLGGISQTKKQLKAQPNSNTQQLVRVKKSWNIANLPKYSIHIGQTWQTVQFLGYAIGTEYEYWWGTDLVIDNVKPAPLVESGLTVAFEIRNKSRKLGFYIPFNLVTAVDYGGVVATSGLRLKYYFYNPVKYFQMYLGPSFDFGYNTLYADAAFTFDEPVRERIRDEYKRLIMSSTIFYGFNFNIATRFGAYLDYGYGINILARDLSIAKSSYNKAKAKGAHQLNLTLSYNF